MSKLKRCLFSVFILSGCYSFAQPAVVVHKFDSIFQACVYTGDNQVQCAGRYAKEMDSMLTVVYNILFVRCDDEGKVKLKKEEDEWITERDAYFAKVSTETTDTNMGDEGEQVVILSKDAAYVRQRIGQLLNRLTY
jgi:uncharacterized protein YecT (DUF1311 family)